MILEPIFTLILISFLKKKVDYKKVDYDLAKYLQIGVYISIGLIIFDIVTSAYSATLFLQLCFFALLAAIHLRPELSVGKSLAYSMLPYAVLSFFTHLTEVLFPSFYRKHDDFFESALLFGLLWFVGMWLVNSTQRKALEKERAKREAEEAQNRIMAELKVNLEQEVALRTAELVKQKEELQVALDELKSTQAQLIQSEKMASLGELTAGIAHEIQNPLNFVNNFSEVSVELLDELREGPFKTLESVHQEEANDLIADLTQNLEKINFHGKRADGIVKSMLQHSRSSTGKKEVTNINALADEYIRLSYHGLRAKDKSFNAAIDTQFELTLPAIEVVPQDLGRVFLNLFNNAFYSVNEKKKQLGEVFTPKVTVTTENVIEEGRRASIRITVFDNGLGIPKAVLEKIYQPFFTTKPTGQGTGLGLSMSYDIITKIHGGALKVETIEGEYAKFIITIPNRS
ncbi:sensor histidine kinase [Olivibacter domesticus]|uniref:histidine kinase n=1 Tax=Olivibacter domesticus TaxID=407022 RepID=A0A1H7U4E9_OLID1|nr:ATP-binding protein [Olivibacter domesticus]SEL91853.1 His Kinase A (phospho-acceptor) domain-containing protein [Olivibacter domesticus]